MFVGFDESELLSKYPLFELITLRELWQAHTGALHIELEGQRVGKTYNSHFLIALRIQFHTRRRTLNTLGAIQSSQIDLIASSIN
jgi:hypothetical protein